MSKLKTKSKRLARLWQRVFGFLPVISFGGAALILSIFAIAPNFMNFTHAEEKPALKPSDVKLSMSVDETFHKFNDVYLTSDDVEHEDQNNVTFKPTVETNNPAGYKVFFSDVDEDTSMRSIDATVTDSIRSATPSDFENGVPKNTADNYWYCGILQVPDTVAGEVYKTFFSTNNDLSIPARSKQKLIDEVKYVKPNDNQNNGVFCNISVNKQLAPSTYVGKMIFTTVANTNNLKPATLKDGYSAFRKIPNNRVFRSFKYTKPTPRDFSDEVKNDESIVSNIKPDYEYAGMPGPACPPTREVGSDMYNLTANNTDDEEPVLIWISTNCIDGGLSLRWWSPSGILKLGENCSNFFSTANAPRFDNLDLSGVDLSKCKNMESMFERTDEGFKRINFGDNQFSPELNNTKKMFKGNNKLEEIRTNHDLDLTYVSESSEMFDGNTSLVGSYFNDSCIFTEYNTAKTDGSMAKTINGYFHRVDSDGRHCVAVRSE
jgi:hypothetical protein